MQSVSSPELRQTMQVAVRDSQLKDIRKLWRDIHREKVVLGHNLKAELGMYAKSSIVNILLTVARLEEEAEKCSDAARLRKRLLRAKDNIVPELEILSRISSLILPVPSALAGGTT